MTDFANFLFLNEIPKSKIAEYLEVTSSFITKLCKGERSIPDDKMEKILSNPYNWDTSILRRQKITHSIGNTTVGNNSSNTQIIGENESLKREVELLKQLLEEKERTIQILLNK